MTKLDCNVVNCSYNADNCCRRTDIQVEGTQAKTSSETCCGSFAPKGSGCQSCHTTDVKKDSTLDKEPKTGINNPVTFVVSILIVACLGLAICIKKISK